MQTGKPGTTHPITRMLGRGNVITLHLPVLELMRDSSYTDDTGKTHRCPNVHATAALLEQVVWEQQANGGRPVPSHRGDWTAKLVMGDKGLNNSFVFLRGLGLMHNTVEQLPHVDGKAVRYERTSQLSVDLDLLEKALMDGQLHRAGVQHTRAYRKANLPKEDLPPNPPNADLRTGPNPPKEDFYSTVENSLDHPENARRGTVTVTAGGTLTRPGPVTGTDAHPSLLDLDGPPPTALEDVPGGGGDAAGHAARMDAAMAAADATALRGSDPAFARIFDTFWRGMQARKWCTHEQRLHYLRLFAEAYQLMGGPELELLATGMLADGKGASYLTACIRNARAAAANPTPAPAPARRGGRPRAGTGSVNGLPTDTPRAADAEDPFSDLFQGLHQDPT
ncbi:hypothetical protein [Deinococcus kurensis]|uniref:hypothetical protein n=1 Tax=Deinococcus kurensis TaxID=2662757 RepID=UPI0012D2B53F|nr:hypothetical protein [Deinococcus kurensis]